MKTDFISDGFDEFMKWLAPEGSDAGKEYLEIYKRLCRIFSLKGCNAPEEPADQVMERMQELAARSKLPDVPYEQKLRYLLGVARNVYLEYLNENRHRTEQLDEEVEDGPIQPDVDMEGMHRCLADCLKALPREVKYLLLRYHQYEEGKKIEHRRAMAEEMQITLNSLRQRVCRITAVLERCLKKRMDSSRLDGSVQHG